MPDVSQSARARRRGPVFVRPEFRVSYFQSLLRIATAGSALSLGALGAHAGEVNWIGDYDDWGDTAYWDTGTVPTDADIVNFSAGSAGIVTAYSVDTLNVSGSGLVRVDANGVLNAATINLSDGGELRASVDDNGVDPTGTINVSTLLNVTDGWVDGAGNLVVGDDGTIVHSGGAVIELTISTPSYTQSGGNNAAFVTTEIYNHADGTMGGVLTTGTYNLTGAGASSSGGTIDASVLFALAPESDTATVDAYLTGTGDLVKSGGATVVLTNAANDFTGTVSVEEGTLEAVDDALPDDATVSIDDGATLVMRTGNDTVFNGTMTGEGALTKEDGAALTLGGEISLGTLAVNAGTLNIGTGGSENTVTFGSATVTEDGTLYVADDATLTIDEGGSLTNNGNISNYGTLNDALDNTSTVNNYASWVGDILGSTGNIVNHAEGSWVGNVANGVDGSLSNYGIWDGDVAGNASFFDNLGADAVWTGDVVTNESQISNKDGAAWNGDVLGNNNVIFNEVDSTWTGDVIANGGGSNSDTQIVNNGTWIGDVKGNAANIYNHFAWTGDVVVNTSRIINYEGVWTGDILGNTGNIVNNAGASWAGEINNGVNGSFNNYGTWTGDVVGNAGFFYNRGADAVLTGDVVSNEAQITNETGAAWNGDVLGNNNSIFNEADSVWTGDVIGNGGGSNTHAFIDNYGIWNGDIKGNALVVYNDFEWNGDVVANAGYVVNYAGIWTGDVTGNAGTVSNRSGTTWNGDVTGNDGIIENRAGGTWVGAVLVNDGTINNKGVWTGAFTNAGIVNAENQINGGFDNSGTLNLTGSLAGITTLTNTGTVDLRGNGPAQTLSVANAIFGPHSVYGLDVDAAGNTDMIAVTGTASLGGAVNVAAATGAAYDASTVYTILTANNITGEFQSVTTDLAFLAPRLSYEPNAVELTLLRNDVGFGSAGTSPNQGQTGGGVESLGGGNTLYNAVLWLNADQAAKAFDELSGEVHSSVGGANVQDAGLLADVLTDRMDEALDASLDASRESSTRIASNDAGFVPALTSPLGTRMWGQIYGKRDSIESGSNVAGMDTTTGGFAAGFDGPVADWRLGLMLQAGLSRNDVAGLNSSADSTDYGLGIYGGKRWGRTGLSLGVNYTRHDISSDRTVAFPGIVDTLSADYSSGTAQVFGKLSQRFDLEAMSLSPYASLAYVRNDADGFSESGGPAALTVAASHTDAVFTTVGLGAAHKLTIGNDLRLMARGKLGWRHTFADTPTSLRRFAGGSDFTVSGAPIDGDTIITGAGVDINEGSSLDISYEERVGSGVQGHALMGTWAMEF